MGFHLALPYKTPWLLLLTFSLPLTLALPYLLSGRVARVALLAVSLAALAMLTRPSLAEHTRTSDLRSFNAGVDRLAKAYGGKFYIAIEGGHYWPLPYYLRKYPVGFDDFPQAAKAPLRLIPATDSSEPVVPGYAVFSLTLREGGDHYWVLVAKAHESVFIGK